MSGEMDEDKLYRKAERLVNRKVKFYRYLVAYVIANVILFAVNLFEIHGNLSSINQLWFLWITILWGIWLVFHYFKLFIFDDKFDDDWMEEKIQKEIDRMQK